MSAGFRDKHRARQTIGMRRCEPLADINAIGYSVEMIKNSASTSFLVLAFGEDGRTSNVKSSKIDGLRCCGVGNGFTAGPRLDGHRP